ncbi:hypothetical protein UNDKW_1582 [Undibacterium sp. KW1]|nr:hypothetical protein UNDKW_1582 [Undibacterium sp. KW1]
MLAGGAAIEIEVKAGLDTTVSVAVADLALRLAVIIDVPVVTPVAIPLDNILATELLPELQVTKFVTLTLLLSEYVPIATNAWVEPIARFAVTGVIAIEFRVTAGTTVNEAEPVLPPSVAVISAGPVATAVARPFGKTVATRGDLVAQVTPLLMFAVVPSE